MFVILWRLLALWRFFVSFPPSLFFFLGLHNYFFDPEREGGKRGLAREVRAPKGQRETKEGKTELGERDERNELERVFCFFPNPIFGVWFIDDLGSDLWGEGFAVKV